MKNFITHNEKDLLSSVGTSLQGYIDISYWELVELFGEPIQPPKGSAEWIIKTEDGKMVTVYNYDRSERVEDKTQGWHVGGNDRSAVAELLAILSEQNVSFSNVRTL